MVDIIERDPPFTGIARNQDSMGIIWCDDPTTIYQAEDPGDWIDGIERYWYELGNEKPKRTPWHFYISDDGEIFEGLGWGAYSSWHQDLGKNEDVPHDGSNSICVLYLGSGVRFTEAAHQACYELTQEHRARYTRTFRPMLLRQVNTNSHSGGVDASGSLAEWSRRGGAPIPDRPVPTVDRFAEMSVAELKDFLNEHGVEFGRSRKDRLMDLARAVDLIDA